MSSSPNGLILLFIVGLAVLFFLVVGVGLLVFVMKRSRKSARAGREAGPSPQPPVFTPPPSQPPLHTAPDYTGAQRGASGELASPPPAAPAPRMEAINPALFETQRSDDRPSLETQPNERPGTFEVHSNRPGSGATRDQAVFETMPNSEPRGTSGVGRDLFATTPSVSSDEDSAEPAAHLRAANGAVVRISPGGFRLGRHPDCHFVVPTPGASRQHAEIRYQDGGWVITDLNSGNGTYVNGVRIRSHRLAPGDEVRIDQTMLTFDLSE